MRVQAAGGSEVCGEHTGVRAERGGEQRRAELQEHDHGVLHAEQHAAARGFEHRCEDGRDCGQAGEGDGGDGVHGARQEPARRDVREGDDRGAQEILPTLKCAGEETVDDDIQEQDEGEEGDSEDVYLCVLCVLGNSSFHIK